MKSKPRANGPGDRAIDRFLHAVTALDGGVVREKPDALWLEYRDQRSAVRVARNPADPAEWHTRFARVEKHAASILSNPPLLYAVTWRRGAGTAIKQSLRLINPRLQAGGFAGASNGIRLDAPV